MTTENSVSGRRQLRTRETRWAHLTAAFLTRAGVEPNWVSIASIPFGALGGYAIFESSRTAGSERLIFLGLALVGILGRLLCNMWDGMIAVEGGKKSATGDIYNDLPDRITDWAIIGALGFGAGVGSSNPALWLNLGWGAATLAIFTAYLRLLGAACGVGHHFLGPMAKQHRMGLTIAATVAAAFLEPSLLEFGSCYRAALILMLAGMLVSSVRRTLRISRLLNEKFSSRS